MADDPAGIGRPERPGAFVSGSAINARNCLLVRDRVRMCSLFASRGRLALNLPRRPHRRLSPLRWLTAQAASSGAASPRLAPYRLHPFECVSGTVQLPGSKSLSNRVLLLAALTGRGETVRVENLLYSDDIRAMLDALRALGIRVDELPEQRAAIVHGCGGCLPPQSASTVTLSLGNAGTAMRPLTAMLCAVALSAADTTEQTFLLDGTARMRERPIQDLVDALQQLGAEVECARGTGCPPVRIRRRGVFRGGRACVRGKISSQYLSALLMAAPLATEHDVELQVTDTLVSVPYVQMTVKLMERFGVRVQVEYSDAAGAGTGGGVPHRFRIAAGQRYRVPPGGVFPIEGDASSASYFLAAAAISGGDIEVRGCGTDSVQGDVRFAEVLQQMGAQVTWQPQAIRVTRDRSVPLRGVDVDCGDIPDAAMTLAVAALFAIGRTAIRNVYNWRVKETERMHAIVTELRKLGAQVEEGVDYCVIEPPPPGGAVRAGVAIDTYDDHRMAMAFSLVACGGVEVVINDPACVRKTFPDYFQVLESVAQYRTKESKV
ncbi:hypothetical protein CDCA_CDCA18G4547 [Cyanidium caldarium]|uniref:3-phosphoshikimate 1-carboxyvinyltransferase n=1 Tax=Cyanidium caldarium TaxID=2771 RepID=A0AAV9J1T6_CYACA|nr:hypothetical protein CDCA_CDCA18G4547 [Cyanidium caldarium]